jgi:hypothetical protein
VGTVGSLLLSPSHRHYSILQPGPRIVAAVAILGSPSFFFRYHQRVRQRGGEAKTNREGEEGDGVSFKMKITPSAEKLNLHPHDIIFLFFLFQALLISS